MFTTGAAIGSLVTWRILKSYYERYVQEEIDKFVDDWSNRDDDASEDQVDAEWNDFEEDEDEEEDD